MKVEFLNAQQGAKKELARIKLEGDLSSYVQSAVGKYPPIQPRTSVGDMNDREIEKESKKEDTFAFLFQYNGFLTCI